MPCIDGTGNCYRMHARLSDRRVPVFNQPFRAQGGRSVAGPVDGNDTVFLGNPAQSEAVATDTARHRFCNALQGASRNGSVDRISTGPEHVDGREASEGMRGGRGAAGTVRNGPPRKLIIAHGKSRLRGCTREPPEMQRILLFLSTQARRAFVTRRRKRQPCGLKKDRIGVGCL